MGPLPYDMLAILEEWSDCGIGLKGLVPKMAYHFATDAPDTIRPKLSEILDGWIAAGWVRSSRRGKGFVYFLTETGRKAYYVEMKKRWEAVTARLEAAE